MLFVFIVGYSVSEALAADRPKSASEGLPAGVIGFGFRLLMVVDPDTSLEAGSARVSVRMIFFSFRGCLRRMLIIFYLLTPKCKKVKRDLFYSFAIRGTETQIILIYDNSVICDF